MSTALTGQAWVPPADESAAVHLPEFLNPLVERLAEHVHDRWAEGRLREGWRFGPERNDQLKTMSTLVPYADLPEQEKEFDRVTALATLRFLHREGYRLVAAHEASASVAEDAHSVEKMLTGSDCQRLDQIERLWRSRSLEFWMHHPGLLYRAARQASDTGGPLLAFDMVSRLLTAPSIDTAVRDTETEARLRHLAVLSLMEVGALERARQELELLERSGWNHGDLQGLRGRLAKTLGLLKSNPEDARKWFLVAREAYLAPYLTARETFLINGDMAAGQTAYYLGINAASLTAWSGDLEQSRALAGGILEICAKLCAAASVGDAGVLPPDPWLEATRGEAFLLRGETASAEAAFRAAASAMENRWRPLQSMRRQALETARRTGIAQTLVEGWFQAPELHFLGLSGEAETERVCDILSKSQKPIVFYFLRGPGQLEEARRLLDHCEEFHLGLDQPLRCMKDQLAPEQESVLQGILASVTRLHGEEELNCLGEPASTGFAFLLFRGAALLRAHELDIIPCGLSAIQSQHSHQDDADGMPFRAMLFADAKGYSGLDTASLRIFNRDFLGLIGEVVARYRETILTVRTAGDGLFVVFRDLPCAIGFSLALRDATAAVDWTSRGLPAGLGLRISLDAGPVLEYSDPVTGRPEVAGHLVNRAARIEPITPVNHVYASRTLAALALALEVPDVRFEYAGETVLPKGFGTLPLYHLTRIAAESPDPPLP